MKFAPSTSNFLAAVTLLLTIAGEIGLRVVEGETIAYACHSENPSCPSVCKELGLEDGYMGCCFSDKSAIANNPKEIMGQDTWDQEEGQKATGSCYCCRTGTDNRDTCAEVRAATVKETANREECRCNMVEIVDGRNSIHSSTSCGTEGGYMGPYGGGSFKIKRNTK